MNPQEALPWVETLLASPKTTLIYLFLSLLLYDLGRRTRRWYRLRHVPGPWICGWTSLWLLKQHLGPRIDQSWKKLVEEYGPVVRMAPNEILLADADELVRIQSPRSVYRKDDWYQIGQMSPPHHNLLSMQDKEARRERKRKVGPGYNGLGGTSFESGLNKAIESWICLLERKYVSPPGFSPKPLDLALQAHYYSLDSLGEIAYSRQLGFLQNDADMHKILETNEKVMPVMFVMSNFIGLGKHLKKWPLSLLLPRDGDQVGFGAIMGVTTSLIDARLAEQNNIPVDGKEKKKDILQSFIDEGLTREELNSEVTIQFFVGSDTVASLIRMTFLFLLSNPAIYSTLQGEIDAAIEAGLISSPITDAEARQHLPYLQAVIRESLRFFPPVACGVFYKNVPEAGDTLCGRYALPAGTKVSTVAGLMALNRDSKIWGEDADVFRPERWLEAEEQARQGEEEKLRVMSKTVDLNFGGGQFLCSGQKIALTQANKVLPELLRRYNFSLVDPIEPIKIRGAIAWMAHDLWVNVEKRESGK
ncbi:Cytochrome P450 [Naviculisporaceae sp. PSN 640]